MKMAENPLIGLVMNNFSFSHSVFKRLELQTHKNQGLFGKGLRSRAVVDCSRLQNCLLSSEGKIDIDLYDYQTSLSMYQHSNIFEYFRLI